MKKLTNSIKLFILFVFLFLVSPVAAHALTIDAIGGDDSVTGLGSTVKTYQTLLTTFTVSGTASPSTNVVVAMDDFNQTTVANSLGNWLVNFSNVAYGDHNLIASSAGDSLDLVLTVGTSTASTTATTTTSTASTTTTTTTTLPEAGTLDNTILLFAFGMLVMGLGVMLKAKN